MIICPNCQNQETNGAIFCSHCGSLINAAATITTHKIVTSEARAKIKGDTSPYHTTPPEKLNAWASLHIVESGQIIPLADRFEFTLGRVADGQPVMPDVDLTQNNAYANGVSRLHAVLKNSETGVFVTDLGSSNGTYLNGDRLPPHTEQLVRHGDLIYLGKLKIQVLIGQENIGA